MNSKMGQSPFLEPHREMGKTRMFKQPKILDVYVRTGQAEGLRIGWQREMIHRRQPEIEIIKNTRNECV